MASKSMVFEDLEQRRRALGMSHAVLAKRSGLSEPTIHRILSSGQKTARFSNVQAIASALGMGITFGATTDVSRLCKQQAQKKAERLVGMVQGTSGLEAQAVDEKTRKQMIVRTRRELLSRPKRVLWNS